LELITKAILFKRNRKGMKKDIINRVNEAKEIDKRISEKQEISLLTGIPMALKDNILVKDKKCTAASKILENYIAPYDATCVKKLKKQVRYF